jgi:hypothetical protein
MSDYAVEKTSSIVTVYRNEAMLESINAMLEVAVQHPEVNPLNRNINFPANLAEVDIERFLRKMSVDFC